MNDDNSYPIRYVSQFTGIPAHVIRAWERRYNVVTPQRTPTNRRLYSESDIKRLQLLRKAVAAGHSISQLAGYDSDELIKLINRDVGLQPEPENGGIGTKIRSSAKTHYSACLNAVLNLDSVELETALNHAAVDLTRLQLINELITPLFVTIGKRWANGSLKIINEHMASAVVRSFLEDLLRSVQTAESAPKIVIATPVGQWHEIGALIIALLAAETGWRPLYFGPNLPAEEIAAAARRTQAKAVAISVTHAIDDDRILRDIRKLKRLLKEGTDLYVGGAAADIYGAKLKQAGTITVTDLDDFRSRLDSINRRSS